MTIHETDGGSWLADRVGAPGYDLVFADTWPGTFTHRDEALSLVRRGGFYVVDDLGHGPEGAAPDDHRSAVDALVADLESRSGWAVLPLLGWSCGVLVLVRAQDGPGAPVRATPEVSRSVRSRESRESPVSPAWARER